MSTTFCCEKILAVFSITYYCILHEQAGKILWQILKGSSDANIKFSDLRNLLIQLGFEERVKGNHHLYRKPEVYEKINIQKDGNKAKPYQIKQVRNILLKYKFGGSANG